MRNIICNVCVTKRIIYWCHRSFLPSGRRSKTWNPLTDRPLHGASSRNFLFLQCFPSLSGFRL